MSDHTDGCSYQSCTCKPGPMTELEAAERLTALLTEIEAATGQEVHYATHSNVLWVGDTKIHAPREEGDPWEVEEA